MSNQTIHKIASRQDPFARVPHSMLEDKNLSWKAKGILAYLCGKPDDWQTRVTDIAGKGRDGTRSIRSGLLELRKCGYAALMQIREAGKFRQWVWKIADTPLFLQPDVRNAQVENAQVENAHLSKNNGTKHNSSKNQSRSKESPSGEKERIRTKQEQLQDVFASWNAPTREEFDEFVEEEGLTQLTEKRPDLYDQLDDNEWRTFTNGKLRVIRDWRAFVKGLNRHLESGGSRNSGPF